MFTVGDMIVYANSGVCKVEGITKKFDKDCYILDPLYEDGIIYVPVDTKLFMRKVITKEEAMALIDSIPDIDEEMCDETRSNDIKKFYSSLIDEHTLVGLVKTIKSVNNKNKARNKIGQVDRRYMKRAEQTLYGELACALDIPYEEIKTYVKKHLSQKN